MMASLMLAPERWREMVVIRRENVKWSGRTSGYVFLLMTSWLNKCSAALASVPSRCRMITCSSSLNTVVVYSDGPPSGVR